MKSSHNWILLALVFTTLHSYLFAEQIKRESTRFREFQFEVRKDLGAPENGITVHFPGRRKPNSAGKQNLMQAPGQRNENSINNMNIPKENDAVRDKNLNFEVKFHDVKGNPVVTVNIADWDIRKVAMVGLQGLNQVAMRLLQAVIRGTNAAQIRRSKAAQKARRNTTGEWDLLVDFNGFIPRKHMCLQCFQFYANVFRLNDKYCDGSMRNIIGVNVPTQFLPIFETIRSALSPAAQDRTKLYSENKTTWDFIDKIIPRNQLPERLQSDGEKKQPTPVIV